MAESDKPTRKRSFKLHIDELKLRHTTHWDTDFMSREEFDAYMRGEGPATQGCRPAQSEENTPAEARPERPATAWERFLATCLGHGKRS